MERKTCPTCGADIKRASQRYCSRSCYNAARTHYKTCVVCGKQFACPPSADTICCSRDCAAQHRRRLMQAECNGNTTKMLAAKENSPVLKPDENHVNAKGWVIRSPAGEIYRCQNLMHWLRQHEDMLDGTVRQAWDGISKIKYSLRGKRKVPCYQWKGWMLVSYD